MIKLYEDKKGQCPYLKWFDKLKDNKDAARIEYRIRRIESDGNFGIIEPVDDGVYEFKFYFGPGYRVYFGKKNNQLIIPLMGGHKGTQKRDIEKAKNIGKIIRRKQMTRNFHDSLIEHLKNKEYAREYLTVALEAYEEDANIEAFLTAIRDITKAQGGFSKLAKKTSLNRSNLYTQLSATGNPSFQTIDTVLHSLGFRLSIQSVNHKNISSVRHA